MSAVLMTALNSTGPSRSCVDNPQIDLPKALIRWIHPKLGFISPGDFIPLFESNGLIQMVDDFVWNEAAIQIRKWKDQNGIAVPVSVNVSRIDILDSELESSSTEFSRKMTRRPLNVVRGYPLFLVVGHTVRECNLGHVAHVHLGD